MLSRLHIKLLENLLRSMTLHGFGNWSLLKEYKFRDLPEKSRTCAVGWYQALHKRDWERGYASCVLWQVLQVFSWVFFST